MVKGKIEKTKSELEQKQQHYEALKIGL